MIKMLNGLSGIEDFDSRPFIQDYEELANAHIDRYHASPYFRVVL